MPAVAASGQAAPEMQHAAELQACEHPALGTASPRQDGAAKEPVAQLAGQPNDQPPSTTRSLTSRGNFKGCLSKGPLER